MATSEDGRSLAPSPQGVVPIEPSCEALIEKFDENKKNKYIRFAVAALSGIPWVGGVIGASANLAAEKEQEKTNDLQRLWIQEHQGKIGELIETLQDIYTRLDGFGDEARKRIESSEFLDLVRRTFRSWDNADTKEKRQMLKRLITNAGATTLCPDDLVRLFIHWIDLYHEAHFLVIKEVYDNPSITRGGMWDNIRGERPREDSAEADLFKYLIRELSTGGVIRQERERSVSGEFLKKTQSGGSKSVGSKVMESAFEDTKPYELTELGKQFVHYVMDDVAKQIETPVP